MNTRLVGTLGAILWLALITPLAQAQDARAVAGHSIDAAAQQQRADELRREVDTLRKRLGLPPVNMAQISHTTTRSAIAELQNVDHQLELARERLQIGQSMTPQERDIAARLYVTHDRAIQPGGAKMYQAKRDGEWMMRAMKEEVASLQQRSAELRTVIGTEHPERLNESYLRELEQKEKKLQLHYKLAQRLQSEGQ
ncbi:MAG: hypothetical protein AMS22_04220 [Thiotrichales bacterium SG8_50]|nr:MAG: hypothetical protein AMS22_04220 [Thiotrichales bacterium SG8_50]